MSSFPASQRLLIGGIVMIDLFHLLTGGVVIQYNPGLLSRVDMSGEHIGVSDVLVNEWSETEF